MKQSSENNAGQTVKRTEGVHNDHNAIQLALQ